MAWRFLPVVALLAAAGCGPKAPEPAGNALANPGFEEGAEQPAGWTLEQAPEKGRILRTEDPRRPGNHVLTLRPAAGNTDPQKLLGAGQVLQGDWLKGARLHLSARIEGDSGARPRVALLAMDAGGGVLALAFLDGS
ncbi:MAG: hypothetical protein LDL56_11460, partial [Armatimonadetes bacterium]|nr:hypothetical protein [Armatimonadota bacterium]